MGAAPAGISDASWLLWPAEARAFILEQQRELWAQKKEIERLHSQLTDLAMQLADLRERIGHSSRNSSRPPSSDGPVHSWAVAPAGLTRSNRICDGLLTY
jgi:uncharacterized coiled-coil protein SlyX